MKDVFCHAVLQSKCCLRAFLRRMAALSERRPVSADAPLLVPCVLHRICGLLSADRARWGTVVAELFPAHRQKTGRDHRCLLIARRRTSDRTSVATTGGARCRVACSTVLSLRACVVAHRCCVRGSVPVFPERVLCPVRRTRMLFKFAIVVLLVAVAVAANQSGQAHRHAGRQATLRCNARKQDER